MCYNYYRNTEAVTWLEREVRFYRKVQLLTDNFSNLFSHYHLALHLLMITFVVMSVLGSVRTGGFIAIVQAYLGFWVFLTYWQVMNRYADINLGSNILLRCLRDYCSVASHSNLRDLRKARQVTAVRRDLRSMKGLRIQGGSSAFYFDKQLVLTAVGIVFGQSLNLLNLS